MGTNLYKLNIFRNQNLLGPLYYFDFQIFVRLKKISGTKIFFIIYFLPEICFGIQIIYGLKICFGMKKLKIYLKHQLFAPEKVSQKIF